MVAVLRENEVPIIAVRGMDTPQAFGAVEQFKKLKHELGFTDASITPQVAYAGDDVLVTFRTDGPLADAAAKAFLTHPKVAEFVQSLPKQLSEQPAAPAFGAMDMGATTAALADGGLMQGNLPVQQRSSAGLKLS